MFLLLKYLNLVLMQRLSLAELFITSDRFRSESLRVIHTPCFYLKIKIHTTLHDIQRSVGLPFKVNMIFLTTLPIKITFYNKLSFTK